MKSILLAALLLLTYGCVSKTVYMTILIMDSNSTRVSVIDIQEKPVDVARGLTATATVPILP